MSNSYNQIATVTIDIASTIVDTTSFDSILLVGALPAVTPEKEPAPVGVYTSLDEVTAAGWAITGESADPIGVAARVAFSQSPAPSKIYIVPLQKTDDATESVVSAVTRAMAISGWYVVCPVGITDEEITNLAAYVETQEKMMVYTELGYFGKGKDGADSATVTTAYNRTAGVYGRESSTQQDSAVTAENKCMNVALAVAWLANAAGSETAAFKKLAGVKPSDLSGTEMNSLKTGHISYLTTIGGKNVSMIGQVLSGEWCDIIRFRDWQKNDMQVAVASLFLEQPKIPFTDGGISLIQNAMEASLQRGQDAGGIAETTYDADGNESLGYEVFVPTAASVTDNAKAARELKNCKFKAKLTGAIHFAELSGSLAYSI